jgi:hypothetical protein
MNNPIDYSSAQGPTRKDFVRLKWLAIGNGIFGALGIIGFAIPLISLWGNSIDRYIFLAELWFFILIFLSSICIAKRSFRIFSILIASLLCLLFPIGTAIGAITIVILRQRMVRLIYQENNRSPNCKSK